MLTSNLGASLRAPATRYLFPRPLRVDPRVLGSELLETTTCHARPSRSSPVRTAFRTVTITRGDRTRLLDEMRRIDSLALVVREFENAGATRPVRIPQGLKPGVAGVLDEWAEDALAELRSLPGGIFDLWSDLADDLAGT
jgi:hypothetical protein